MDDIIKAIKKENSNILASVDAAQIGLFMSTADNEDALLLPWKKWDPNVKWGTKRDPVIADANLYSKSYKTPGNEKESSGNEKQSFYVYYRVSVDDKLSQRAKIRVNIGDDVDDMKNLIKMENSNTFASIDAIQIKISCKISECKRTLKSFLKWDPNVAWGTITTPLIVKLSRGSFIEREIESVRSNVGATVTPPNQVRTSNGTTEPESAAAKSNGELELQDTEEDEDDEDYQLQDTEEEEDDEDFHSEEVDQISPLKSDSELELQDTEEEDEDCNSDGVDSSVPVIDGPTHIIVERAGIPAVNGTYKRDGILDNCARYVRNGLWKNKRRIFEISVYAETESKKDWFISMLGANPDDEDTLFYIAPMSDESNMIPARVGWDEIDKGENPSPRLIFIEQY